MNRLLLIPAVTALLIGAPAAAAQPGAVQEPPPQARVTYADLDLATPAGQQALRGRLEAAVARICPAADPRDLTRAHWVFACRTAALAGSETQIAAARARALAQARPTAATGGQN